MNKKTYLIVLPLLVLALGLLGCIRGVTGDSLSPEAEQVEESSSHVQVNPRVEEALQTNEWVAVYISIGNPPGFELPSYELYESDEDAYREILLGWDLELYDRLRAERRASVLSALGSDYKQVWNAGDHINTAGLEKLRNHPFVVAVAWPTGTFH